MDLKVGKRKFQKMILVRMSEEDWECIRKEAESKRIGISTLSRVWIMEGLERLKNGAPVNRK
jgi:hypothetical protein